MSEALACHYHQDAAVWRCDNCRRHFGECCIPPVPEGFEEPSCVLCNQEMAYLGAAHSATPFWLKINDFFLYPIRLSVLGFLAVCVVISFLMPYTGPAFIPLSILLACVLTKYSLQIVESVSLGDWNPPGLMEAFSSEGLSLFFKQMAIFVVMGVALYFSAKLGLIVTIGVAAFMFLALPASMMVLAREHSVGSAVNPLKLAFVMAAIGWPYLLLYFFLIILYGGPGYFMGGQDDFSSLYMVASFLLGGYFSFVMCAMMGYCLFQYQDALGYAAEMDSDEELDESLYLEQKVLADSLVYMREGREREALKLVKGALAKDSSNPLLNKRFHKLLVVCAPDEPLLAFTKKYIQRLLITRNDHEAADVYLETALRVKGFMPEEAGECFRLAKVLATKGMGKEALKLLHNLHRRFPGYGQVPEAYLLAARLMSESFGDDRRARQLLQFVLKNYPDAPEVSEVRVFLGMLDRLAESV